ncbi:hypothetical protein DRJ48_02305 [Candidatus Woesearchaeota archaeon]|nr:MAG: hypothetical protein DRJ48_02305 [Candidatus Woesearchaeota archaeon]
MYQKEYKILALYLGDFKGRYYLREISKQTGLSLRTTQRTLKTLEKAGVIKSKQEGKNKYFFLNLGNIKTKFHLILTEIWKTINFIEEYKPFGSFLKEEVKPSIIVFGSFARFEAGDESDLDLLVVGKAELPFHLLPYKLHKIELTEKQFERALRLKEPLIKELLKNHIVLTNHSYFIELFWAYYEKT